MHENYVDIYAVLLASLLFLPLLALAAEPVDTLQFGLIRALLPMAGLAGLWRASSAQAGGRGLVCLPVPLSRAAETAAPIVDKAPADPDHGGDLDEGHAISQ